MSLRDDLPSVSLATLVGGRDMIVLCASTRLAAGLRRAHGRLQAAAGAAAWQALQTATLSQWLDHVTSAALLRGEIPPSSVPGMFLTRPQEQSLWEQAVANDAAVLGGDAALFDQAGMARTAMEAERLCAAWRLDASLAQQPGPQTEEYRAFERWRTQVAAVCEQKAWSTADTVLAWRIACIARGVEGLPLRLGIAGFVAPDPWLSRLLAALEARGVELFHVNFSQGEEARQIVVQPCADADAECEAVSRWAREILAATPEARLRIAVADLPARRRMLSAALDAALHPDAVGAAWVGLERDYAFAPGTALAEESLVATALSLLGWLVRPQSLAQAEVGALLRGVGWSADVEEADARAMLESELRDLLPPEFSLERLRRTLARSAQGATAPQLLAHVAGLAEVRRDLLRRQTPGDWGKVFVQALQVLGWPGQRALLAREGEVVARWQEMLMGLTALDAVLGRIDGSAALRLLRQQCRDHAFSPARQRSPRVEVCRLEDALAEPVEGLWLMGMDEAAWPFAARPNPLLSAEIQRRAGIVEARVEGRWTQAQAMQALWCAHADTVVFSWPLREGERELRPSPLLSGLTRREIVTRMTSAAPSAVLESVDDSMAPAVGEHERVRGGTALLKAQAICPAWGFYQYRLGANALPTPVFGLDARARGFLVHAALETFWSGRNSSLLSALAEGGLMEDIRRVVCAALDRLDTQLIDPLTPRLRMLEQARLERLLALWLAVEAQRSAFEVIGCETKLKLDIAGLPVRVTIDRIDRLSDGRLVILDYKTGRNASADSWADERISEPQLPIYAALAFPDQPLAAVAIARVALGETAFVGVAEDDVALPGVKALEGQRRRFDAANFPDWDSVRACWGESLQALAQEILSGQAAVFFADEKALEYCEVRPLLRLAERRAQAALVGNPV